MDYYINSEVAHEFNVSNTTVSRWIEASQEKKNNLQLILIKDKFRIVKNQNNISEIQKLIEEGEKFKNSINHSVVKASNVFYDIFSEKDTIEIVNDLELRKEINLKFTYTNTGATIWDQFYEEYTQNGTYLTPLKVTDLLEQTYDLITQRIDKNKKINLIEIGPGNSKPTKKFIDQLIKDNLINSYIVIDISEEMIEISKKNIKNWFPELSFQGFKYDIEQTRFENLFYKLKNSDEDEFTNIILNVGGTIGNYKDMFEVLRNLQSGMIKKDILLISNGIYKPTPIPSMLNIDILRLQHTWIPKELGFDIKSCEIINKIDESRNAKVQLLKLDKDYTLEVNILNKIKKISFKKGEEISIWWQSRNSIDSLVTDLKQCGLRLVGLNTDSQYSHFLAVCEAETK